MKTLGLNFARMYTGDMFDAAHHGSACCTCCTTPNERNTIRKDANANLPDRSLCRIGLVRHVEAGCCTACECKIT